MQCGYLYIASGELHRKHAIISAKSLRTVDDKAHIILVTDKESKALSIFDKVIIRTMEYSYIDKVKYIYEESPYEKSFFLDADTYFYSNCRGLFELLDFFDLCIAAAPGEDEIVINGRVITGYVPYNSGVIIYRKNSKTKILFEDWLRTYTQRLKTNAHDEGDQVSLSIALMHSESRVYVLPYAWNARLPYFVVLNKDVKIAHGFSNNYAQVGARLNASTRLRCWNPHTSRCIYRKPFFYFLQGRLSFLKDSIVSLLKKK
jgi:hypothetical protein